MSNLNFIRPQRCKGMALPWLIVLVAATLLWMLRQHSTLMAEMQSVGDHRRQVAAFQAAQSGLEGLTALLNDPMPRGNHCRTAEGSATSAFRDSVLSPPDPSSTFWRVRFPLALACRQDSGDWVCSCPDGAVPASQSSSNNDGQDHPSFAVRLSMLPSGSSPVVLNARADGCTDGGSNCLTASQASGQGRSRIDQSYTLLGRWAHLPPATLAAAGTITLSGEARVVSPPADSAQTAIVSGETVSVGPQARVVGTPGSPTSVNALEHVPQLAPTVDGWLRHLSDLPSLWWRRQPTVHTLACPTGTCRGEDVIRAGEGHRTVLWVDGDLLLDAPSPLGSALHPLLLVARGRISIADGSQGWGLLLGQSIAWHGLTPGQWQGGLVSASTLDIDGPITVIGDLAAVQRATDRSAAWVPLPGSWHEVRDVP